MLIRQLPGYPRLVNIGQSTPWGPAQQVTRLADGIHVVSTAGHGGILLSAEMEHVLQSRVRFTCFGDNHAAYEEDCDAVVPLVVLRDYTGNRQYDQALQYLRNMAPHYPRFAAVLEYANRHTTTPLVAS